MPPDTPFRVAVKRYLADGGREDYLDAIERHMGPDITIAEMTDTVIAEVEEALGGHLAENSRKRQISGPIRVVLNHAFDTGRKRGTGKAPPRWLTPDEAERMLEIAAHPQRIGLRDPHLRTRQKIAFMLGTGAFPGEVITIRGEAFERETGIWSLPGIDSLVRPRTLLPPARAAEMIGDVPARGSAFLTPDGQEYVVRKKGGGQMAEAFGQIRAAAGLGADVTPATCRTTWAIWLYAQARDLETLVEMGGWAGPRSAKPLAKLAEDGLGHWVYERGWDFRDGISLHDWRK